MNDVDDFLKKYEAKASLSRDKLYARVRPMSRMDYSYDCTREIYNAQAYVDREPYVEMYIPQHKFQEMVERDRYYKQMAAQHEYATELANQQIRDEVIRKTNPAVEKAWRNYQLLLEMCRK